MRKAKRIVVTAAAVLLVLAATTAAVFALGRPTTGQASSEMTAPDPGGSDPLAIEIPGCVCHSEDPAVVEAHAQYRMSECLDCHSGGMPGMGM
jgi:hypothetical protein